MPELLAHAGSVGIAGVLFIAGPAIIVTYISRRNKRIEKHHQAQIAARLAQQEREQEVSS